MRVRKIWTSGTVPTYFRPGSTLVPSAPLGLLYVSQVIADGAVLLWGGDSPGTNLSTVGGAVTGTPTFLGSPTTGQTIVSPTGIRTFTSFVAGSSQAASWNEETALDFTATWTIEFWMSGFAAAGGFNWIVMKGYNSHVNPFYVYGVGTNSSNQFRLAAGVSTGGFTPYDTGVAIPTGSTWHHIACTYNGSGNINLYIDGAAASYTSAGIGSVLVSTGKLGLCYIPNLASNFQTANLAAVALYPTELSAATVAAHYALRNS